MKIGDSVVVTDSGTQYRGKIVGAAYGSGCFFWRVEIDGSIYTYREKKVKPFRG